MIIKVASKSYQNPLEPETDQSRNSQNHYYKEYYYLDIAKYTFIYDQVPCEL